MFLGLWWLSLVHAPTIAVPRLPHIARHTLLSQSIGTGRSTFRRLSTKQASTSSGNWQCETSQRWAICCFSVFARGAVDLFCAVPIVDGLSPPSSSSRAVPSSEAGRPSLRSTSSRRLCNHQQEHTGESAGVVHARYVLSAGRDVRHGDKLRQPGACQWQRRTSIPRCSEEQYPPKKLSAAVVSRASRGTIQRRNGVSGSMGALGITNAPTAKSLPCLRFSLCNSSSSTSTTYAFTINRCQAARTHMNLVHEA
eukprot:scaffold106_cov380-Prasinococcus_capsulatus_cf.AAC.42